MTNTPDLKRRSLAVTTAIASIAVAIGVTTASMLGWFAPARAPSVDPVRDAPVATQPTAEPVIAASHHRDHDDDDHDSDEDSDD